MKDKKSAIKKILHVLVLVGTACVLASAVLLILMTPFIKGKVYYTKEGLQKSEAKQEEDNSKAGNLPKDLIEEPPMLILFEIRNEDIFEKGYYEHYVDIPLPNLATIGSNNEPDSNIEWKVYISDTQLAEDEIYALEDMEPVAVNKGEAEIKQGQWIYVLCNINSQTSDKPSDSMFSIGSFRDYAKNIY